jgi:ubiquinone/menaquinone biosynthesis C-methylase UbiE
LTLEVTDAAIPRFREVVLAALGACREEGGDALADAYGDWLADPMQADTFARYHLDLAGLARFDPRGKRVLDAGCGFGLALVVHALAGAERASGLDADPARIAAARRFLRRVPGDLAARIELSEGDVSATPYEEGSFDLILSNEAIETYLDPSAFLAEASRLLRPAGALIVVDANNKLNPVLRRRTRRIWRAYELGPAGQVVHGHRIENPYVDQRAEIVRTRIPELADDQVRTIAENTSGMTESEMLAAARRYADTGAVPSSPYRDGELPVDPAGLVVERLVDPYELARELSALGLAPRVYGYWGGASGRGLVRAANAALTPLSRAAIYSAPAFRVVATKPSSP